MQDLRLKNAEFARATVAATVARPATAAEVGLLAACTGLLKVRRLRDLIFKDFEEPQYEMREVEEEVQIPQISETGYRFGNRGY